MKAIWAASWMLVAFVANGPNPLLPMVPSLTYFPLLSTISFLACVTMMLIVPMLTSQVFASPNFAGTCCHCTAFARLSVSC